MNNECKRYVRETCEIMIESESEDLSSKVHETRVIHTFVDPVNEEVVVVWLCSPRKKTGLESEVDIAFPSHLFLTQLLVLLLFIERLDTNMTHMIGYQCTRG